jgi:hypothetical protein
MRFYVWRGPVEPTVGRLKRHEARLFTHTGRSNGPGPTVSRDRLVRPRHRRQPGSGRRHVDQGGCPTWAAGEKRGRAERCSYRRNHDRAQKKAQRSAGLDTPTRAEPARQGGQRRKGEHRRPTAKRPIPVEPSHARLLLLNAHKISRAPPRPASATPTAATDPNNQAANATFRKRSSTKSASSCGEYLATNALAPTRSTIALLNTPDSEVCSSTYSPARPGWRRISVVSV